MDYDAELKRTIRQNKKLLKLGGVEPTCSMCGCDDPRALERHHIAGRANSDLTTWLCRNCHSRASDAQEDLVPDLRRGTEPRSPLLRQAAMLQGAAILLILLAIALAAWATWNVAAAEHLDIVLGSRWWDAVGAEVPS